MFVLVCFGDLLSILWIPSADFRYVMRPIVFSQEITYIFMGEPKTATDSINVQEWLIRPILDAQRIISTIIKDTKVTLTQQMLQHRFKWINDLYIQTKAYLLHG